MSKGCWEINRSCLCLSLPAVKAGCGLRGGRFALETRCSSSRQLPISSQIGSLTELIHLSWFQSRWGGGIRSYVNVSKNEIKTSRARRICSNFVGFFFPSQPSSSLKLSFDSGSVMNQLTKRSNRLEALCRLSAFLGFQA